MTKITSKTFFLDLLRITYTARIFLYMSSLRSSNTGLDKITTEWRTEVNADFGRTKKCIHDMLGNMLFSITNSTKFLITAPAICKPTKPVNIPLWNWDTTAEPNRVLQNFRAVHHNRLQLVLGVHTVQSPSLESSLKFTTRPEGGCKPVQYHFDH